MTEVVFEIAELKTEILNIRRNQMYADAYKKYLQEHPLSFFYNKKENIYIRRLNKYDHIYCVYDIDPINMRMTFRSAYYHKY